MLTLLLIFTTIQMSTNSDLDALKQLGLYFQTRMCEKERFPLPGPQRWVMIRDCTTDTQQRLRVPGSAGLSDTGSKNTEPNC